MENKIKLYNELKLRFSNHKLNDKFDLDSHQFSSHDMIEFAGAIGIKLLELAAENANLYDKNYPERIGRFKSVERGTDDWTKSNIFTIDKQSILDTINQVE